MTHRAIGSEGSRTEVELLVAQVLETKKNDFNADTTALEQEIDQLVYKLYDLSEEEIAIIEGSINEK